MTLELEGYRWELPVVERNPGSFTNAIVKFEELPIEAERRASKKRGEWVERHLGEVSETFSKLVITAPDISSLLRAIEEDFALVHAAYYTDDECIARIADWIAIEDEIAS
jgi:hypothetical protein